MLIAKAMCISRSEILRKHNKNNKRTENETVSRGYGSSMGGHGRSVEGQWKVMGGQRGVLGDQGEVKGGHGWSLGGY